MAITNSFREAVSKNDVMDIRIMMEDSLLVDLTFTEFNEMSHLASGVIGLYEQHDGRELQNDISMWDDDYMNKLMVHILRNFSKERLDHLKAVVRHLRPVASQSQSTTSQTTSSASGQSDSSSRRRTQQAQRSNYQEQKHYDQHKGNYRVVKNTAGAIIGGAVGGTIAGVSGGSVIIGVAVGAVVVGTAVAITTNRK